MTLGVSCHLVSSNEQLCLLAISSDPIVYDIVVDNWIPAPPSRMHVGKRIIQFISLPASPIPEAISH